MDRQERLITLFSYIYRHYESELFMYSERMSDNAGPEFIDAEVITVYLWGIMNGHGKVKSVHEYVWNHLSERFPQLPSYAAYIWRLNRISLVFSGLPPLIQNDFPPPPGPHVFRLSETDGLIVFCYLRFVHNAVLTVKYSCSDIKYDHNYSAVR